MVGSFWSGYLQSQAQYNCFLIYILCYFCIALLTPVQGFNWTFCAQTIVRTLINYII